MGVALQPPQGQAVFLRQPDLGLETNEIYLPRVFWFNRTWAIFCLALLRIFKPAGPFWQMGSICPHSLILSHEGAIMQAHFDALGPQRLKALSFHKQEVFPS